MKKANRSVSSDSRATFFPQSPVDGQQHGEHGRIWQWVADPGMWRSVTGGATIDGDLATQDALDAEIQDREDGDTALGLRIDAEAQARSDGDDALGLRIDAVEGSIGGGGGFIDAPNDGKLYGRASEAWAEVVIPDGGASSWNDLTDKPTEFPPAAHNQGWETITDKPADFPPSAHNHTIAQVTGLQTALDDAEYDDSQVTGDLATETQARIDGDSDLQGQIDAIDSKVDGLPDEKGVVSVNGNTGPAVVLTAADVGALPDTFDGGVDPGTAAGQILRWDGTDWKHTSKVMLDSHGMMTVDSGKIVGDTCGLLFDAVTDCIVPIDETGAPSNGFSLGNSDGKFMHGRFTGQVEATEFKGDGSQLTNLPSYDDSDLLATIAALEARIETLENAGGGGGDSFWEEESPGVIKYTGTAKATYVIGTG